MQYHSTSIYFSYSYFDISPSDPGLTPADYSYDTLKKIYEKEYSTSDYINTQFELVKTKNNKTVLIGTTRYRDSTDSQSTYIDVIVVSYPYMTMNKGEKEYKELTYRNSYEGSNPEAIAALKQFFLNWEPIGDSPF